MSCTNYSKWDHIELSDDEDDTHPNIDTPSLFRWRHQARIERDAQWNDEKSQFERKVKANATKMQKLKESLTEAQRADDSERLAKVQEELKSLELEQKEIDKQRLEMEKKERIRPLNVDTISREGQSKTIINKEKPQVKREDLSEEEQIKRLQTFVKENDSLIKRFSMLRKPDDSQAMLLEHTDLVCEETANRLVLWCVDLAVEEKFDLMDHVAHQCIVMQFMLELAKSLKIDPRAVIRPFFAKFRSPEPEYQAAFNDELNAFKGRVRTRAKQRVAEAMAEYEAEERKKRLGPGGLDPVEVFETLPKCMQECFENKDLEKLQTVIATLPYEDAKRHMDRCIASGMWVPDKGGEECEFLDDDNSGEAGEDAELKTSAANDEKLKQVDETSNAYDLD